MARLVSYKTRDENRYSTFANDETSSAHGPSAISDETINNLNGFQLMANYKRPPEAKTSKPKYLVLLRACCPKLCRHQLFRLCCCCGRCRTWCTCCRYCSLSEDNDDSDDDDDIDRKFAQIKYEMTAKNIDSDSKQSSVRGTMSSVPTGPAGNRLQLPSTTGCSEIETSNRQSQRLSTNRWNWDDSLRSNSDKFLETLEVEDDMDGECSFRRKLKVPRIRITSKLDDANTPEVCNSPLIGTRTKSGSASPIASHGSASSDPWPSQSEEDIDRLVALHQNRNSLSSLGLRSDSMASVYSGAGDGRYGTVTVKGQIEFGMQYNYKQSALEIQVVRCKELAAVDAKRNRSDPYVKVYLLPDKSKGGKRKTKVKKHTLNPVFEETLKFHMPLSSLESRNLWLTVWHSDMFGRNDFLGEVTISLQGKVFDNPQSQWYTLQERTEPYDDLAVYRGDIIVGLKFVPPESSSTSKQSTFRGSNSNLRKFGSIKSSSKNSTSKGQLHVLVKEAKNLSAIKPNGTCDAFCKSYLLPDRTRGSKQKTPVVKKTVNPVWNYTFIYEDVSLQELSERALELTVWDHDRLASNEFLGGVRFSLGAGKQYGKSVDWMDATGKELSLWQNMLNRPNFWVEGCLILRSSLDGGSKSPQ